MNRRSFTQLLAASAAGSFAAPVLTAPVLAAHSRPAQSALPYSLSVMLWTVFRKLPPVPPILSSAWRKWPKPAYRNVELVGEYDHWQPTDFDRAKAACKTLRHPVRLHRRAAARHWQPRRARCFSRRAAPLARHHGDAFHPCHYCAHRQRGARHAARNPAPELH